MKQKTPVNDEKGDHEKPAIIFKPKNPKQKKVQKKLCEGYAELMDELALDVAEATAKGVAKAAATAEHFQDEAAKQWHSLGCHR